MAEAKLAVLGLGLIGGSILQAMVRDRPAGPVAGWDASPEARTAIRAAGYGRCLAGGLDEACSGATLVVIAVPVSAVPDVAVQAGSAAGGEAVITDTGSTKRWILDEVGRRRAADGRPVRFVGGHPLAGAERGGFRAGSPDLFRGQPWLIVSEPEDQASVDRVAGFVRDLGAVPMPVDAATHDRVLAYTSHLPYLLATALAATASNLAPNPEWLSRFAAGGFRDATRLALQEPAMGLDFLRGNLTNLADALRDVSAMADELLKALDDRLTLPMAEDRFRAARATREELGRIKEW